VAEVATAAGVAPTRVVLVDGEALSWHGARTLEGLAYADVLLARLAAEP
jgi:hypothetical protein